MASSPFGGTGILGVCASDYLRQDPVTGALHTRDEERKLPHLLTPVWIRSIGKCQLRTMVLPGVFSLGDKHRMPDWSVLYAAEARATIEWGTERSET